MVTSQFTSFIRLLDEGRHGIPPQLTKSLRSEQVSSLSMAQNDLKSQWAMLTCHPLIHPRVNDYADLARQVRLSWGDVVFRLGRRLKLEDQFNRPGKELR